MWTFMKSAPWTFGIGAVIFVVAIVGVIVGVITKGRWIDRGLMKTKDGKPIKWPLEVLPLGVWLAHDLHPDYAALWPPLRDYLNKLVGRDMFDLGTQAPPELDLDRLPSGTGMIAIRDDNGMEPDKGSTVFKYDVNGALLSAVITIPEARPESAKKILLHELLHALGLDHDESVSSIMNPTLQARPQEMSDADRNLLKKVYG